MLGNSIALMTLALMLGSEGRRTEGPWRAGLYTLAIVIALAAVALQLIVNALPAVGTTLSAIFGNAVSWFILAISLFFVLRPFWQRKPVSEIPGGMRGVDIAEIDREAKIFEAMQSRFSSEIDQLKMVLRAEKETDRSNLEALQVKLNELGELSNSNHNYVRRQVASLYDALAAVYHRERLHHLAQKIEAGAVELAAPSQQGKSLDQNEWERWQANEGAWRFALNNWCELAACYVRGIDKKVLTAPDDHYKQKGVATIDQFPNRDPEAFFEYKTFFALWKNWKNSREDAERAVHQVAFNGGTAGSRPIFPGGGKMEELGAKGL